MAELNPAFLISAFRFEVALTRAGTTGSPDSLADGGFQECSGLELEADIKEYLEGGRNDGVIRRVGRVKLQPIVLKRGMFRVGGRPDGTGGYADTQLWNWIQGMVAGRRPIPRYNGSVLVKSADFTLTVAHWVFDRGLPLKVTGPALNARTGDIAIEELHIAHEGLRLEAT